MSQVYHEGNFYYARAATIAGESPATHPAKWQVLEVPGELRTAVALRALAGLMEAGDPARARELRAQAATELAEARERAARRDKWRRNMKVVRP